MKRLFVLLFLVSLFSSATFAHGKKQVVLQSVSRITSQKNNPELSSGNTQDQLKNKKIYSPRVKKKRGISSSVVFSSNNYDLISYSCCPLVFSMTERHLNIYFSGNGKRGPPSI